MNDSSDPNTPKRHSDTIIDAVKPSSNTPAPSTLSELDAEPLEHAEAHIVPPRKFPWRKVAGLIAFAIVVVGSLVAIVAEAGRTPGGSDTTTLQANLTSAAEELKPQTTSLPVLGRQLQAQAAATSTPLSTLTINGQLEVNGSLVLAPSSKPSNPVAGQLYYNQSAHDLAYYNGVGFIYLQGTSSSQVVNNITYVTNNYSTTGTTINSGTPIDTAGFAQLSASQTFTGVNTFANTVSIVGTTSDAGTDSLTVANSSGTPLLEIGNAGTISIGEATTILGNDYIGTAQDSGINDLISADKFTTGTTAESIESMSVYVGTVSTTNDEYQMAIYTDDSGKPGTLVAGSAVGTLIGSDTWNTLPVTATLSPNTSYWLAYDTNSNNSGDNDPFIVPSSEPTHAYADFSFGTGADSGLPTTFPAPTTVNDYSHSIYALASNVATPAISVTPNGEVGIDTTTPQYPLDVSGAINSSQAVYTPLLDSANPQGGLDIGTSHAGYINIGSSNTGTTTVQASSNLNLEANSGTATVSGNSVVLSGANGTDGGVIVEPQVDSTEAFQVQNANGQTTLLNVDTVDNEISLGTGAGNSLGDTSIGPYAGGGSGPGGAMAAQHVTTTSGGTITSISAYIGVWGIDDVYPCNEYQFAIYSDNSGLPGNYIASSSIGELGATAGWYTLPISATLAANTTYWMAYWQNACAAGSDNGYSYSTGVTGAVTISNSYYTWQTGSDNGWPASYPIQESSLVGSGVMGSIYASYASSGPALTINSSGTLTQDGEAVFQDPTDSSQAFQVNNSLGDAALDVDTADNIVTVTNLVTTGSLTLGGHIITGGGTPTIAVGAAASCAGGSPAVSITGNDTAGTITVQTGTGCTGGGTLATITFAAPYGAAPIVELTPGSPISQTLGAYVDDSTISETSFDLGTNATPLDSQTFEWNYLVVQ